MENDLLQYIFIFFISMVPFIETFISIPTAIIVLNFPPLAVLMVSILGNITSVLFFIFFGIQIKKLFYTLYNKLRKKGETPAGMSPRMKRTFDRYGATGVCFLSSILFSSQVGAGTMASLGAPRSRVFIWTNLGVITLAIIMSVFSVAAEGFVSSFMNL